MTDTEPTPAELVRKWRMRAEDYDGHRDDVALGLKLCATELEAALRTREPAIPDQDTMCECGHDMSAHSTSGCLAPSPTGRYRPFCACLRRTVDGEHGRAVRWASHG